MLTSANQEWEKKLKEAFRKSSEETALRLKLEHEVRCAYGRRGGVEGVHTIHDQFKLKNISVVFHPPPLLPVRSIYYFLSTKPRGHHHFRDHRGYFEGKKTYTAKTLDKVLLVRAVFVVLGGRGRGGFASDSEGLLVIRRVC